MAKKTRNRRREGAGKSEASWKKQDLVWKAARSQVFAYRHTHPHDRIVLIDGNAGDGVGVDVPQADLFDGEIQSRPTPQIITEIADNLGSNVDVIICESDKTKREGLHERFPRATILADHKQVPAHIRAEHCYALWVSDPCGPSDHGVETMSALAGNPRIRTDFVVILNQAFINRLRGTDTDDPLWATSRERYLPMADPFWWGWKLKKAAIAESKLIRQSNNFHFRLLIVANHLGDVARGRNFAIFRTAPRLVSQGTA